MVDYLIVTFIPEEYEAVLRHFRRSAEGSVAGVPGETRVVSVTTRSGQDATAAIARTEREGNISALSAVLQLIDEHKPRVVLAVGIGGGVPTSDLFLGDVLLANDVHDLTRGAETLGGRQEATASTYLMSAVKTYVANLTLDDLSDWGEQMASIPRPPLVRIGKAWTGDEEWDLAIDQALTNHRTRSWPTIRAGVVASSDHLVKSEKFMRRRLLVDRGILGNDMESVGVAKACETKEVPLLILRGISDIVGLPRSDEWKRYACEAVAGCARELVGLDAVETIAVRLGDARSGLQDDTRVVIESLDGALAEIRGRVPPEAARTCRDAFGFFRQLPEELKRRWAPDLFDTLDRPMKCLGDKELVLQVAEACIACCSGVDLDDNAAECQARARICGTSWVYQRTGRLGLAEQEAQEAVRISEGVASDENLAFCKKCLGRIKRLRAETATNTDERRALFSSSVSCLRGAIGLFGAVTGHGPDDAEVGDCYSLLGRTHLSAGDVASAWECAAQARQRIDVGSKDYLDLCILQGDLLAANRKYERALQAFEQVIRIAAGQDYQVSEIVARAHLRKGEALLRTDRKADAAAAFDAAEEIWTHYGEVNFAAEAEWGRVLATRTLDPRTIRLLEREEPRVRCEVVMLYEERQTGRGRAVVGQRVGADDTVWKNLVRRAKRNLALKSPSE